MMNKIIRIIRTIGTEAIGALVAFYTIEGVVDDFLRHLPDTVGTIVGIALLWIVYKVVIVSISHIQNN